MEFAYNCLEVAAMERLKTANRLVGRRQSERAIQAGQAACVYVAEDADPWVRQPVLELCAAHHTPVVPVPTMRELAKACQVEVPTAVAAVLADSAAESM